MTTGNEHCRFGGYPILSISVHRTLRKKEWHWLIRTSAPGGMRYRDGFKTRVEAMEDLLLTLELLGFNPEKKP